MTVNLSRGSVIKNIVFFSLPFLLSYFLQTLYGMADLFIAGQFNGSDIISAVSIGSQVMHMLTVVIVGLAMGTTVLVGRGVGAGDSRAVSKTVGNTVVIFSILALILSSVLLIFVPSIVSVMSTPLEAVLQTETYLRICFAGLPFIISYNVIASVFRGMGDSKSPLIFVAVACAVNVILDYVFMGCLKMKSEGAALATVFAQAVSVVSSLVVIVRKKLIKISKSDFRLERKTFSGILKIGGPIACQDCFIQISFLIITRIANSRGLSVATAVGIVEKIITFLFLVPSSMLSTVSAIASQNIGAKQPDRARKTLFCGAAISVAFGLVFALLFQFVSEPFISLFIRDGSDRAEVIRLGVQYIRSYVFDCVFAGIHFSCCGYFCALGKSMLPFINNVSSIILVRIPGAYLASKYFPETLFPMGLAAPLGSLFSSILCVIFFVVLEKKNGEKHVQGVF